MQKVYRSCRKSFTTKRSLLDPEDRRQKWQIQPKRLLRQSEESFPLPVNQAIFLLGTGFVVGTNTIVTNNHVAESFKNAKVLNPNAKR